MAGDAVAREMVDHKCSVALQTFPSSGGFLQSQIGAAMRQMAAGTRLGIAVHSYVMLEDERPSNIRMAAGAGGLFVRNEHVIESPAVDVMTIGTVDLAFQHRMVGVLMKLVFDRAVALEAELVLRLREHLQVIRVHVHLMTIGAADIREGVGANLPVVLVDLGVMAFQAEIIADASFGLVRVKDKLGRILGVQTARSVALLAPLARDGTTGLHQEASMGLREPLLIIDVAGETCVRANELGLLGRRRILPCGRSGGGGAVRLGRVLMTAAAGVSGARWV